MPHSPSCPSFLRGEANGLKLYVSPDRPTCQVVAVAGTDWLSVRRARSRSSDVRLVLDGHAVQPQATRVYRSATSPEQGCLTHHRVLR